jgi:transcriptional regulator with XRE-family HTH domain
MQETLGNKIRIQRLIKSYSQEYMAFMLEISQPAYSKIERDETKPNLDRIYEIAEILEISAFILLPKPKYGTGINGELIQRTLYKLKKFWTRKIEKRKAEAVKLKILHSDKSNNEKL